MLCHFKVWPGSTTAAYHHVLFLCKYSEEAVVPLLDVNVQETGGGEGAATGAANVSVQGVVVVFKLLQSAEDCTATSNVTSKLWHTENEKEGGGRKVKI